MLTLESNPDENGLLMDTSHVVGILKDRNGVLAKVLINGVGLDTKTPVLVKHIDINSLVVYSMKNAFITVNNRVFKTEVLLFALKFTGSDNIQIFMPGDVLEGKIGHENIMALKSPLETVFVAGMFDVGGLPPMNKFEFFMQKCTVDPDGRINSLIETL